MVRLVTALCAGGGGAVVRRSVRDEAISSRKQRVLCGVYPEPGAGLAMTLQLTLAARTHAQRRGFDIAHQLRP